MINGDHQKDQTQFQNWLIHGAMAGLTSQVEELSDSVEYSRSMIWTWHEILSSIIYLLSYFGNYPLSVTTVCPVKGDIRGQPWQGKGQGKKVVGTGEGGDILSILSHSLTRI